MRFQITRPCLLQVLLFTVMWGGNMLAAPISYRATALGTLGGAYSRVGDINASGQVVGSSQTASGVEHGFLFTGGRMIDLGAPEGRQSWASTINDAGQVTGTYWRQGNIPKGEGIIGEGFFYSDGQTTTLPSLGGMSTLCCGINERGEMVGVSWITGNETYHAFKFHNGALTDLGTLGGHASSGADINNSGQITGYSWTDDLTQLIHAFLYTNGEMIDLGTLGGRLSNPSRINESGQITGYSEVFANGPLRAFFYTGGAMKDLGTLGGKDSAGIGINNRGQVTGSSDMPGDALEHAFLYTDGIMYDLNALVSSGLPAGAFLTAATGINDNGWIVANGSDRIAYLLQPEAAVPEPASVLLVATGIGVVAGMRRRARGRGDNYLPLIARERRR